MTTYQLTGELKLCTMKTIILLFFALLPVSFTFSQSDLEALVQKGVGQHDSGQYEAAIDTYKKALKLDPNSTLVHYEMAMTYMSMKEYEKSIKHSDIVLKEKGEYMVHAYLTKGSCLDYLGKTSESVKLFEKAIKDYPKESLLYYNLALNYYRTNALDKAEKTLMDGLDVKSDHPSSHLLLGYIMSQKGQTSQALLSLYYFLLLEPNSNRSAGAYEEISHLYGDNVSSSEPGQINITLGAGGDSEFAAADLMVAMLQASDHLEENKGKTPGELFVSKTESFFKVLGELNEKKNKGFYWEFYVPFFYDIAQSEHIDTYCYYISQSSEDSATWIRAHMDRLEEFADWLDKK